MMLSVILLSLLMILLPTLNMTFLWQQRNWLLNSNLIYETLWTGAGSDLLISLLEKLNWFRLTG